jgi:hypothetical protein
MMFSDDMGIMTFSAAELQLFPLRETESARGAQEKCRRIFPIHLNKNGTRI